MGIVEMIEESDFFCTVSVGMNCRDGSNIYLCVNVVADQIISDFEAKAFYENSVCYEI